MTDVIFVIPFGMSRAVGKHSSTKRFQDSSRAKGRSEGKPAAAGDQASRAEADACMFPCDESRRRQGKTSS
jgi:hypothetical protein